MNRRKILFISITLATIVTVLLISGVFACGCGGGSRPTPISSAYTSPPIMVPPMPQYETMWKTGAVIKSLKEKGLAVEKQKLVFEDLAKNFGDDIKEEAVSFDLPSAGMDAGGSINTFKHRSEQRKIREHFLDLNKKGTLHTWSFTKDNVLLILTGNVPEKIARQYETALLALRK